ncbi:hypothetical protein PACILC2_08720 [Paenibacillus cisolokensis]|uniref:Sugar ABC transporter permease n=1 Tax=Paenibacillus cisolokensis TaxID=1658519 RepID=A0ABQ4N287_9BACL|nr:hypothetical protein PACILC2_08720 [Paenibacillus cisolokensis]
MMRTSSPPGKHGGLADRLFDIFNIVFMILLVVVTLYPFINMLAMSFNDANDSIRGGIYLWPRVWTLHNYEYILTNRRFTARR